MTEAGSPSSTPLYPPDPTSVRWDVAFAIISLVVVLLGSRMAAVELVLLHVATAAAIYVYARPRTGRVVAFGVGIVFLALGNGADAAYASIGLGWWMATAAGAWSLVIMLGPLPIRRAWLAGMLLAVAAAVSGAGLFFIPAVAVVLLPEPRRHYLLALAPAVVAVLVRIVIFGSNEQGAISSAYEVMEFTRVGISDSVGLVSGFGSEVGLVLAVLLGAATLHTILLSDSMRLGLVAGAVGIVTEYALIAAVGGRSGMEPVPSPTYVYPAAVFILIAAISLLAHRPLDRPCHRHRLVLVVAALTAVAVTSGGLSSYS